MEWVIVNTFVSPVRTHTYDLDLHLKVNIKYSSVSRSLFLFNNCSGQITFTEVNM